MKDFHAPFMIAPPGYGICPATLLFTAETLLLYFYVLFYEHASISSSSGAYPLRLLGVERFLRTQNLTNYLKLIAWDEEYQH
jgi:hypothetical protein